MTKEPYRPRFDKNNSQKAFKTIDNYSKCNAGNLLERSVQLIQWKNNNDVGVNCTTVFDS